MVYINIHAVSSYNFFTILVLKISLDLSTGFTG